MKKIFLIVLVFIAFGCNQNPSPKYKTIKTGTETNNGNSGLLIIDGETIIQNCEYFLVRCSGYHIPIHKGNCKNPIHHHFFDSTKYVQRIELDSMKIDFLEKKLKILKNERY